MIHIPTLPVGTTLQTFVIFLLALTLSPREALGSVLFYLVWATLGLPVLCGRANSLWFMGISSGYLIAFPFAAYLISYLARKWNSTMGKIGAIACGQAVIYTLGFLFLIPFIGVKAAFIGGVAVFIPTAVLKALLAVCIKRS